MVQVWNQADLQTVPGSWYYSGGTLYIHLFPHQGSPSATNTDVRIMRSDGISYPDARLVGTDG